MANNKPRSTDYFDQGAEGRFEPVVETPKSKFVPIENVASSGLSPEDICILCETALASGDSEVFDLAIELLEANRPGPHPSADIDLPSPEEIKEIIDGDETEVRVFRSKPQVAGKCHAGVHVRRRRTLVVLMDVLGDHLHSR